MIILTLIATLCFSQSYQYSGTAKDKNGKLAYTEKHIENWKDGKVQTVQTTYYDNKGEEIAVMNSDFTKNVRLPEHIFTDKRAKLSYGFKFKKNEGYLIVENKDKKFDIKKNSVVGQGFHQWLLTKMDGLKQGDKGVVDFIFPGREDSYDFKWKVKEVKGDIMTFDVYIDNWFLRLFAPSLKIKYDTKKKVIVYYKGLSNIKDPKGEVQAVTISYEHTK